MNVASNILSCVNPSVFSTSSISKASWIRPKVTQPSNPLLITFTSLSSALIIIQNSQHIRTTFPLIYAVTLELTTEQQKRRVCSHNPKFQLNSLVHLAKCQSPISRVSIPPISSTKRQKSLSISSTDSFKSTLSSPQPTTIPAVSKKGIVVPLATPSTVIRKTPTLSMPPSSKKTILGEAPHTPNYLSVQTILRQPPFLPAPLLPIHSRQTAFYLPQLTQFPVLHLQKPNQ